jgi:hypothetical protein
MSNIAVQGSTEGTIQNYQNSQNATYFHDIAVEKSNE